MASVLKLSSFLGKAMITDHDEALAVADAALKSSKLDSEKTIAQRIKVVALLNLERYDDVLRVFTDAGSNLESQCVLEKAYALYKTGELQEAEALLKKTAGAGRALKHIMAQVAYRAEKFDEAADLYNSLIKELSENPDEENDLKINQLATHAQLEWQGNSDLVPEKSKQPVREDLEAFETAYNAGCGCVARGDLAKAKILLKRARDLCEAAEYLSPEEKRMESVPIIMQQAYVCSQLGDSMEAAELQSAIEDSNIPDGSSNVVAACNALIFQGPKNPYLLERHFEQLPEAVSGNDRLFQHQAVIAMRNEKIVRLNSLKFNGLEQETTVLLSQDPTPSISAEKASFGMINARAVVALKEGKDALKKLLPVLDSRPYDVGLHLTVIQLFVQAKNFDMAIDILRKLFKHIESTPNVRFAPGLVALAVTLYRQMNRRKDFRAELASAAAHWQKAPQISSTSLLREAGIELLKSSKPSDLATAGAAFEKIASQNPDDKAATAGLVASFATSDYAKVEPHLSHLTSIDKLTDGVNVTALLDEGVPSFLVSESKQASKKRSLDDADAAAAAESAKPTKKKKKTKLSPGADPNVAPDPERWLPLRDRSTYKPKNKKGKKRVVDSTQGGMPVSKQDECETMPLVGGAGTVKVEKINPGKKGKRRGKN